MEVLFHVKLNEKLYLKDPEQSALGKKIVKTGLELINKLGFEEFTFKKLALAIHTTEATIYRYFENKHRLLVYILSWYWSYMDYKIVFFTHTLRKPEDKLKKVVELLVMPSEENSSNDYLGEKQAYELLLQEGSKSYFTRHIAEDNKARLFKPYKDLCARISDIIVECNPRYKYPHSLASAIIEMSHSQKYFKRNLPSLTDFGKHGNDTLIVLFLQGLLLNTILPQKKQESVLESSQKKRPSKTKSSGGRRSIRQSI